MSMPRGSDIKQIGFSANLVKREAFNEAAERCHFNHTSDFLRIAAEEKLMREFPDLFKRGWKK